MRQVWVVVMLAGIFTGCGEPNKFPGDKTKGDRDMPYQMENNPQSAATGTNAKYPDTVVTITGDTLTNAKP